MSNEVKVYRDGGIVVEIKGRSILVDPHFLPSIKPKAVFVSHAHRDHYNLKVLRALRRTPKIMNQATYELVDPRGTLDNVVVVDERSVVELEGLTLEFHNAGHIIGSLQLKINAGLDVVYTGDFCLEERIVLKPASILKADVLVIDATYGHPKYSFPPRGTLYRQLLETVTERMERGKNLSIAVRALGTGQEVTALLSLSAKLTPLVERRVAEGNKVYEKYGEILGNYAVFDRVTPSSGITLTALSQSTRSELVCTGWAVDGGVPISSHADYDDLLKYVKLSGAHSVFTFSRFSKVFSKHLSRELGVTATSL